MEHFFRNVRGLGNVAVSRHAQARIAEDGIHPDAFTRALLDPTRPDVRDGADVVWRERDGMRIVILINPTPNLGAVLVKTSQIPSYFADPDLAPIRAVFVDAAARLELEH